ncbi:tetratricopeptide repeat protein [Brevibacillus dissolubilis]|uniref:tetratricopeptide repeat protein n=1 Tax=Brevibacillus dissolubilis TaxID=1844116 RepID=UPI0021001251|nr:tetratricopeptide repeat protein [Brevibacillus dissolubilis]
MNFTRDANFFADWGVRLLNRFDYEKALKCFQRAAELDPSNVGHLYQKASILAEMGKYEDSNDILYKIVDEMDSNLVDAYFFLANNFANMEDFEMAEENALRYLQTEATGMYAEEAEDLLNYIYFELDMPPRHPIGMPTDSVYLKHENARRSLEEGRFLEAVEHLREIVETHPDFIPAWNNLALAYYYVGDFDRAVQTIDEALEKEPGNLHALCNMAVLLSHHNRHTELLPLLNQLKKVVPYHQEHMYKLATTMGVLGQHEEAYQMYQRIMRSSPQQDPAVYHYAATAAYLTDRMEQAVRWWQKTKKLDPTAGIAEYYLQKVEDIQSGKEPKEVIPYHYHHPMRDIKLENMKNFNKEDFKSNPMVRASLLWALQHGKEDAKPTVIKTLLMIGDEEAESALRQFCLTTTDPDLQKLTLLALHELGSELPVLVQGDGGNVGTLIYPDAAETDDLAAEASDSVTSLIQHYLYSEDEACGRYAENIWQRYLEQSGKPLQVRKPQAWVAALEYLYAKQNSRKLAQSHLADKYEISPSTLAKCIKALSHIEINQF